MHDIEVTYLHEAMRPAVRKFRVSTQGSGDAVTSRRDLLMRLLSVASLAATDQIVNAASASASALEVNPTANHALADVTREVYAIGKEHMQPNSDADELFGRALAAWRDAVSVRVGKMHTRNMATRTDVAEATAAGLVAQFWGDRGNTSAARRWYHRALLVAPDGNVKSWLYSCSAWLGFYENQPRRAIEDAARGAGMATWVENERRAFAFGQLARSYALLGDDKKCREVLQNADFSFLQGSYDHRDSPPNLLHFTKVQHGLYMADTLSMLAFREGNKNDIRRASTYQNMVGDVDQCNGMNRALIELSRARCLASGAQADADAAVEHAMSKVCEIDDYARVSSVVKGKVSQLSKDLSERFGDSQSVVGFRGFARQLMIAA